jgi:hypothetical protein
MRVKTLSKPLSALHVWAFVPAPLGVSGELLHSIEHRIFLDAKIAALEDDVVRHNGMTLWSGIQLEFTIPPHRRDELERALASLFSNPLPKMSFEERERFARELEEGGGDFFDAVLDRFKTAFYESNGLKHSGKDEEGIWESLDFSKTRMLLVGDVAPTDDRKWAGEDRSDLVFPVLKEEVSKKPSKKRDDGDEFDNEDGEDEGIDPRDADMDYALVYPSFVSNVRDYAFHRLFFRLLRTKTDTEFRDTGRTYDPISENYFENGFAVSGIHLITSDRDKKLPALPKKPDKKTFEALRDSFAFQSAIDHDQLLFGHYPAIAVDPFEAERAIASFEYGEFVSKFDAELKKVSFFWGRGF